MGATPILGLAIAGFPTDKLPLSTLEAILRGGADKAAEAGFGVAGGHTIIDEVPKYGLAVTGTVAVDQLVRNSTGRAGDVLFLTKPIGNGILVSAHRAAQKRRFFRRSGPSLDDAIRWMTTLNRDAAIAMTKSGVNAATDITGYGLIGHLLEMCRGAGTGATLDVAAVPVLAGARDLLARGYRPEGTMRNVRSFQSHVRRNVPESELTLLCDAQTSGGLLLSVDQQRAPRLEDAFRESGLFYAKVGQLTADAGRITLNG